MRTLRGEAPHERSVMLAVAADDLGSAVLSLLVVKLALDGRDFMHDRPASLELTPRRSPSPRFRAQDTTGLIDNDEERPLVKKSLANYRRIGIPQCFVTFSVKKNSTKPTEPVFLNMLGSICVLFLLSSVQIKTHVEN